MPHIMRISIWVTSLFAGATAVRGFVFHGRQRVLWSTSREYFVFCGSVINRRDLTVVVVPRYRVIQHHIPLHVRPDFVVNAIDWSRRLYKLTHMMTLWRANPQPTLPRCVQCVSAIYIPSRLASSACLHVCSSDGFGIEKSTLKAPSTSSR